MVKPLSKFMFFVVQSRPTKEKSWKQKVDILLNLFSNIVNNFFCVYFMLFRNEATVV
jgi:hypothetical protein